MVGHHHVVIAKDVHDCSGVRFRELRDGAVRFVGVRVGQKAPAVPERNTEILMGDDVLGSVLIELEVLIAGRFGTEDVKDRVEVEVIAGEDVFGRKTAPFFEAAFQHQGGKARLGEIAGDGQAGIAGTDDNDVERFHAIPPVRRDGPRPAGTPKHDRTKPNQRHLGSYITRPKESPPQDDAHRTDDDESAPGTTLNVTFSSFWRNR